jgi:hypothetical protein
MSNKKHYFGFDVESIGVWGPAFAFGYVIVDEEGKELESGFEACPHRSVMLSASCLPAPQLENQEVDLAWVEEHVVSALGKNYVTCYGTAALDKKFIEIWERALRQYTNLVMVADCPFPVETNFLLRAIPLSRRHDLQPYPLLDVASSIAGAGYDPLADLPRKENELPKHHPTNDARQSVRIFVDGMREIERDRSLAIAHGYYGPLNLGKSTLTVSECKDLSDGWSAETVTNAKKGDEK